MTLINRKNWSSLVLIILRKCLDLSFYKMVYQQKRDIKTSSFKILVYKTDSTIQEQNIGYITYRLCL